MKIVQLSSLLPTMSTLNNASYVCGLHTEPTAEQNKDDIQHVVMWSCFFQLCTLCSALTEFINVFPVPRQRANGLHVCDRETNKWSSYQIQKQDSIPQACRDVQSQHSLVMQLPICVAVPSLCMGVGDFWLLTMIGLVLVSSKNGNWVN